MKYKKWIIAILIFLLLIGLCVYKVIFVNPHNIVIREETINSYKLNSKDDELVIAFFSDLHLGDYTTNEDLDRTVELINSVKPDVILFGGDLIDNYEIRGVSDENRAIIINALSKLEARFGKYAVLGEHDNNSDDIKDILTNSKFEIITNENRQVYYRDDSYLNIVGVDSIYKGYPDLALAYDGVTFDAYTIVLTHAPDIFKDLYLDRTDLVLAGHSHGPQIYIPLFEHFYREDGYKEYAHGKHYKNDAMLDITNGVGLSKNSTRLNSDAEVVFYKLQTK